MSEPKIFDTPIGAPIYWIDPKQITVRGTYGGRESNLVILNTMVFQSKLGYGVTRRRRVLARYTGRDWTP